MKYAEVAVNFPVVRSTFCYAIPPNLNVAPGQVVWVPFGSRNLPGIIVELSDQPSVEIVKEVVGVISACSLLSSWQIELARWISRRYLSPLFDCLALMLPPALKQVQGESQKRIKPKSFTCIKLEIGYDEVANEIKRLNKSRAIKQARLLEFLKNQTQPILLTEVRKHVNCSPKSIKVLAQRRIISLEKINVRRDPLAHFNIKPELPPSLTLSQEAAWKSIQRVIATLSETKGKQSQSPPVFLIFGVTGSGKTELYLRALALIISQGKRGICLVPEIALTPQTVERFASRFPGRVGILHSGLSLGEQSDEWQWISEGNCDVVIGPRSTLFSPQSNLGLIIIDEEHEWTYKQEDKSPRYHTRDVAIKLAELSGAAVILGSATPDIESFHQAQLGKYQLIELKERVTPGGCSSLPEVSIVDLKEELKAGNTSLLSRSLSRAIKETLQRGEQIILFLNRRGAATFIQCRRCHFVFRCPRCSVALTFHSAERKLTCHRCNYFVPVPRACPQCFSTYLKFLGVGTQKIEEEVKFLFPEARVLRWDKDVVTRRYAHEELLRDFRDHKADILIGTQMIAKGLDLPQITLAGIINADTGLNFPDFRAGERTFQLLCQVAGRAGRGIKAGKVIIQTYSPENYAIQAAAKHDYVTFYQQEIKYRQEYNYPPFSQLIRLVYAHANNGRCRLAAEKMSHFILKEKENKDLSDLNLIGPMPALPARIRGRYRWQLILRASKPAQVLSEITLPQGWVIDVDPVALN